MRLYRPLLLALALSLLLHLGVLLSGHLPHAASLPEPAKLQPLSVAMQAMTLEPEAGPAPAAAPSSGLVAVPAGHAPGVKRHHRARVAHRADAASAPVAEAPPAGKDMLAAATEAPAAKDAQAAAEPSPAPAATPAAEQPANDNSAPAAPPPQADDSTGLEARGAAKTRRFPDNSRVDYQIYYGSLMAGHGEISWQRSGANYTLDARLTPIIGPHLRYQSRGSVGKRGLTPLAYQAWRGDTERESARFDWSANTLAYGDHGDKQAELAPGTQDILSLGYQLALTGGSLLPPQQRITTGKKVYDYPLAPGGETRYPPDHGTLRVVVFRAKNGDDVTEFWLAPDFANLPVRILRIDKDKTLDQRARRIDINGKTVWSLSENP